jgi:hypothetical protein
LKVEELSVAPNSTFEDEISEPEFDSMAGALAAINDKEPKGEYDDSSDEEEVKGKGAAKGGKGDFESEEDSDEEGPDDDYVE